MTFRAAPILFGTLGLVLLQVPAAAPAAAGYATVCGYRGCITRVAPRPRRVVVYRARPRRVYVSPYPPAYVVRRRPVVVVPC